MWFQVSDHRLEVQKRLKATLGNLRLVWCISGIPSWVFKDIPLDRRRRDGTVIALANQRDEDVVLFGHLLHEMQKFTL